MRIVLVSDSETQGGAAIAASRLAQGFLQAGHRVSRLVCWGDGLRHEWETHWFLRERLLPGLRRRMLARGWCASWLRRDAVNWIRVKLGQLRPDVINLHNLHAAQTYGWGLGSVEACLSVAPTVWTLHDMWSFTGRCAYSLDCRQFEPKHGCSASCPTASEYPSLAPGLIATAYGERRSLLGGSARLAAVTPSRWLAQEAGRGLWSRNAVQVIPNAVPLETFRPEPARSARKALGLETRGPVLLAVAFDCSDARKGGRLLAEALRRLARRPLTLILMGGGQIDFNDPSVTVLPQGFVADPRRQALVYSACDLLVHPALADNLPNTLLEAMACGLPALGFSLGGIPELIHMGRTGWLAGEATAEALAAKLDQALTELAGGLDLGPSCRAFAAEHFAPERQVRAYESLFHSLLESGVGAGPSGTPPGPSA